MPKTLIIVDVQNDFCEGGALPVPGGEKVASKIVSYLERQPVGTYNYIVATADYHIDPWEHFDKWPPHCVAGTSGAWLHADLSPLKIDDLFRKGEFESGYSGFDGQTGGGVNLNEWLHTRKVLDIDIAGIATDYCVKSTALDASSYGLKTTVLLELCVGVATDTTATAIKDMAAAGVKLR